MNADDTAQAEQEPKEKTALTKRDLVVRISRELDLNQADVYNVIQRLFEHIIEALEHGEHVEFRDFGVFQVAMRKSRIGRNPNKPADVVRIPARKVVKFKPGKIMRQKVLTPLQRNDVQVTSR